MCLDPDPNIKGIRTRSGELLILDCAAPLAKGCTVAVLWDGQLAVVGRLLKRPHPLRHLVISFLDPGDGTKHITRVFGLRDADTQVWRVTGVGRDI
jgi:hypothetical protein